MTLGVTGCIAITAIDSITSTRITTHGVTEISPTMPLELVIYNVFIVPRRIENNEPPFSLKNGDLLFLGNFEERTYTDDPLRKDPEVISLDAQTGAINWQVDAPYNSGNFATDLERFYFETVGNMDTKSFWEDRDFCPTGIGAIDLQSGQEQWRIELNDDCKGTDYLTVVDSHLYARTSQRGFGDYYQIAPESGEILQVNTSHANYSPEIFFIDYSPHSEYKLSNDGNVSAEGEVNWQFNLYSKPRQIYSPITPVVLDSVFLLRFNEFGGKVWAVNKEDGSIAWKYDGQNLVSNVTTNEYFAFFLTDNPSLIAVDLYTGEKIAEVTFTPGLGENLTNTSFFVAADEDKVAVYFGSSDQVFIFRLENN
ncbi:MAG: PQQ-binding-like beta-propeller repeat protein [Anaerolineaceae bacterium]|nr:PQQ-binding-like beta-propeller repeat protein [Anaerolineaceae bacterium]